MSRTTPLRLLALLAVTAVAAIVVLRMDRIPQPEAYHHFADDRPWLGIPNFQNVASNLPFLIIGWIGLARLRKRIAEPDPSTPVGEKAAWLVLFLGVTLPRSVLLVPVGSSRQSRFFLALRRRNARAVFRLMFTAIWGLSRVAHQSSLA